MYKWKKNNSNRAYLHYDFQSNKVNCENITLIYISILLLSFKSGIDYNWNFDFITAHSLQKFPVKKEDNTLCLTHKFKWPTQTYHIEGKGKNGGATEANY